MATLKEKLKEEAGILLHNFIMVMSILSGFGLLFYATNIIGNILGGLWLLYGGWLLFTAINKIVDELIKTYFPHLSKKLNKKREN